MINDVPVTCIPLGGGFFGLGLESFMFQAYYYVSTYDQTTKKSSYVLRKK